MKRIISYLFYVAAGFFPTLCCEASAPAADSVVKLWTRFESTFTSSKDYGNPVQDVKVRVEFTSPGRSNRGLLAFWDGGHLWRVRFSP